MRMDMVGISFKKLTSEERITLLELLSKAEVSLLHNMVINFKELTKDERGLAIQLMKKASETKFRKDSREEDLLNGKRVRLAARRGYLDRRICPRCGHSVTTKHPNDYGKYITANMCDGCRQSIIHETW